MLEAALTVWIVVLGMVVASFAGRQLGIWGLVFVAPILGAAVYALSGLVLVAFNAYGTIDALLLASVIAVGSVVLSRVVTHRWLPVRTTLLASGIGVAASVVLSVVVQSLHLTRVSPDSMDYMTMAGSLERYGTMADFASDLLLKRQLVVGVLHTPGVLTGRGYFPSFTLVLALSGVAMLAWLGNRALQHFDVPAKWRWVIVAPAALFVATTNRVIYNDFYVNGHTVFAALLLVGVGFAWYAAVTEQWPLLVLSAIAFTALVPLRAESIAVAALFIVPIIASERIPAWGRWVIVTPFVVVTLIWYGLILAPHLPAADYRPTGNATANIVVALGLLAIVAITYVPKMAVVVRITPWLMLATLSAFVVLRARRGFSVLLKSLGATGSNIGGYGLWSSFWWVAPLLVVAALIVVVVPLQRLLAFGVISYPVALIAFAYLRGSPYRVGAGDSANRMLMHIVFVLVLYVIVAAGVAYREIADSGGLAAASEPTSAVAEQPIQIDEVS